MDSTLQDAAALGNTAIGPVETAGEGDPDGSREDPSPEPDIPPEIIFHTPFPRPRAGALRNIVATILVGVAIIGLVWYFDKPAGIGASQSITLTASAKGPAPKIGREAPDFSVTALDGQTYTLSDFRGQPVWINFWASWCPPCRAENPDIQAVYEANKDGGLVVLAIAIGETSGAVRGYAERTGLTYTIGLDEGTDIAANYRIVGIPTHFFVDRDGVLREWRIGALSKKNMEKKVDEIMASASEGAGQ